MSTWFCGSPQASVLEPIKQTMPDTNSLEGALLAAEQAYRLRTAKSAALIERACEVLPGGNTRTSLHFTPYPFVVARAHEAELVCADGHRYRDYLADYSSGLYGHSDATIRQALHGAIEDGLSFGAPNLHEAELARLLVERYPSIEQVRFANSGSEANLMALMAARAYTGRDAVLAFDGGYHGCVLSINDRAMRFNAPYDLIVGRFNDLEATRAEIGKRGRKIAAILVEPMLGAGGCIPALPAFLKGLRHLADECGAVLIFDEVMTSRIGPAGAQGEYGVTPDMTTLGKFIGGGATFGGFGGRAEIMSRFDSRKPDAIPQSGTFNNNVLTMAAGSAGLRSVYTPDRAQALSTRGDSLRGRINNSFAHHGVRAQATGLGSLMAIHFTGKPIVGPDDVADVDPRARALFHLEMLARGIYFARRGYLSLSLPQTAEDDQALLGALDEVLQRFGTVFND
jgi:glutamate-1-semialdehyde 2,1-aminomutase